MDVAAADLGGLELAVTIDMLEWWIVWLTAYSAACSVVGRLVDAAMGLTCALLYYWALRLVLVRPP